jgi:hypothetical protein
MEYIVQNEGPLGLFKGIGPQILKGVLVQGLLMMTKERYAFPILLCTLSFLLTHCRIELVFILLFRWLATVRARQITVVDAAKEKVQPYQAAVSDTVANASASITEKLADAQASASNKLLTVQSAATGKINTVQLAAENALDRAKSVLPVTTK